MKSSPISKQERLVTIDVIRGFALFGIFLVNMPAFHSPGFIVQHPDYSGLDYWLDLLLQMFVQMKFYTIFSFLFGLGFYIFISRAEKKGLNVNRLFARRLTVLLIFGSIHFIFIWYGDILHTYALTGFFLLLFYKRQTKTLLIWAFSLLLVFHSLLSVIFLIPESNLEKMSVAPGENETKMAEYVDMYENGSYFEWVSYRFHTEIIPLTLELPFVVMTILAMFLFGLYAGKIRIFEPDSPYLPKIKRIWLTTLLFSIPLVAFLAILKLDMIELGVYKRHAVQLFTSLSGLTLCFFYMSSLTLLLRKENWQKWLRPLGYTGQMALTNYLMQTFVSVFIFLGLGFFGKVSLVTGTLICLAIYLFQVGFSYLWLKYFRFGPFEWLWRSLTYGYFQSMKIEKNIDQSQNYKA